MIKVIVGLGNPGRGYAKTRHNIGFMTVESFSDSLGRPRLRKRTADYLREDYDSPDGGLILIRPLMFMNLSGAAMARTGLNWDSLISRTLVVFDDASMEFGRLRIRKSGSDGGHKGMRNIIDTFGTRDIPRLRMGIGSDPEMVLADYVLKPFTPGEKALLPDFVSRGADAIRSIIDDGIESAMNRFNSSPAV